MSISRVEIYSTDANAGGSGIVIDNRTSSVTTSKVQDVHIHDITMGSDGTIAIVGNDAGNSTGNIIERITINDVVAQAPFLVAATSFGSESNIEATIRNSTMTNIEFTNVNGGSYISAYSDTTQKGGNASATLNSYNNTIVTNRAITATNAIGILAVSVAAPTQSATSTVNAQNNIIVGRYLGSLEIYGCYQQAYGAGGTESATFNSLGGNISDDDTYCGAFLTETNDQANVSNLDSTLGTLQDNGGYTPTIALLTGSPAIDNGITNAVTTDQRGTSRPQGSAFDTGAFEYVAASSPDEDSDDSSGSSSLADTGINATLILVASVSLIGLGGYTVCRLKV